MKKVLILGGNGYIGGSLASNLMQCGYHVTVISRSSVANVSCHKYISLDLSEFDAYKAIDLNEVETVIDLVSYVPPNTINVSTSELKQSLKHYECLLSHLSSKHYLFFSSGGTVYGDSPTPLNENSPLRPVSAYGIQKCIQEELIHKLMPKGVIMRVTNPYGGNQQVKHGVGFVAHLLDCYAKRKVLRLTVPDSTTRDYIHINDLLCVTERLLIEKCLGGDVFNVSTGQGTSLKQLIDSLHQPTDLKLLSDIKVTDTFIQNNVLNNSKLSKVIDCEIESKVTHFISDSSRTIYS